MNKPTPAQIEAAIDAVWHCDDGYADGMPRDHAEVYAKAALTAAAEVGYVKPGDPQLNTMVGGPEVFPAAEVGKPTGEEGYFGWETNKPSAAPVDSEIARLQGKINQAYSRTEDLLAILDNRPAAAEVNQDYELKCTNGHDRCYMGTSDDCPYCERVPAAAEVNVLTGIEGEMLDALRKRNRSNIQAASISYQNAVAATIERCAQVVEQYHAPGHGTLLMYVAAAIRAKDK